MDYSHLFKFRIFLSVLLALLPFIAFSQIDIDKQLEERKHKVDSYDDSDADRHGGNMTSFFLIRRLGDKKEAYVDTIKLNYFHRAFIEGLSVAEAYGSTYASPYQSKIYFDRPINKWDEFYFINPYNHLIHRGEKQQWYNVKVPYSFLKYTSTGSAENKEQNFNFKFSSNFGPKWSLGGDFDLDYANGFYGSTQSKNITYRIFSSYEGERYKAYASIGNTNTINQENGGITDQRFISNPNDFAEGKRRLLPKYIPTRYKSTWNRVVFGEGRFHHKFSLGFYRNLDEEGNVVAKNDSIHSQTIPVNKAINEAPSPHESTLNIPKDSLDIDNSPNNLLDHPIEPLEKPVALNNKEQKAPPVRKRAGKSSGQQEVPNDDDQKKEEVSKRIFVPVTNFFHDFSYEKGRRSWVSQDPIFDELYPSPIIPRPNGSKYFPNDRFSALKISNTLGIELVEGFHKWAKMGIAAFVAHDFELYKQPLISLEDAERLELEQEIIQKKENTTYVGGRISSSSFKYFKYYVWGQVGVAGAQAGEIEVNGELSSNVKILKKDFAAKAWVNFLNTPPSYFLRHYKASLHEWEQDLSMIQVLRIGGELLVPFTGTRIHANFETLQNPIRVNDKSEPEQIKTNARVLAVGLDQKLSWRFLNWENSVVWQSSSNSDITPLPDWAIYSNFYFQMLISKVMTLQLGVDAKWHTAYYAPYYEPSTQLFKPQEEIKIGGEAPLMSVYANAHLKRARFFLKYYNVGALIFQPNYFTMPYYPTYPPILRLGVAIDLRN